MRGKVIATQILRKLLDNKEEINTAIYEKLKKKYTNWKKQYAHDISIGRWLIEILKNTLTLGFFVTSMDLVNSFFILI